VGIHSLFFLMKGNLFPTCRMSTRYINKSHVEYSNRHCGDLQGKVSGSLLEFPCFFFTQACVCLAKGPGSS